MYTHLYLYSYNNNILLYTHNMYMSNYAKKLFIHLQEKGITLTFNVTVKLLRKNFWDTPF